MLSKLALRMALPMFLTLSMTACGSSSKNSAPPSTEQCQLPAVTREELRMKGEEFTRGRGFRLALTIDDCDESIVGLHCKEVSEKDYPYIYDFLDKMQPELALYPSSVLSAAKLKFLIFTDKLGANTEDGFIDAAGLETGTAKGRVVFYNLSALRSCNENYYKRVFHHEMGHVLDNGLTATGISSLGWTKLNPAGFSYATTGYGDKTSDKQAFNHPHTGFVSGYGMVNEREDFAEYFSVMHTTSKVTELRQWITEDKHLKAKLTYMAITLGAASPDLVRNLPNYSSVRDLLTDKTPTN